MTIVEIGTYAFPKSAILTVILSRLAGSYGALGGRVLGSPAAGAGLKTDSVPRTLVDVGLLGPAEAIRTSC